jgi:hypothetical protein
VCKDAGRPDEEEQGDGDDQRQSIQQVKVTLVGGQVAVVSVNELGYSEDAPSEVGDAGEEEDVIDSRPVPEPDGQKGEKPKRDDLEDQPCESQL